MVAEPRIGVGLDARLGLSFGQLRDVAKLAELLGFDSVWTPAGGVPDAFHLCAAWAADTALRTGIAAVPTARTQWSAPALATQAASVAAIARAGHRSAARPFVLGVGTGGTGPAFWRTADLPDRPVAIMRDYVTAVTRLLRGEAVTQHGPAVHLDAARIGTAPTDVPVFLAALGPQMLRLAGEVADGVLLNWATSAHIAESRRHIAAGTHRVGRDVSDVETTMYIRMCVDDDVPAARRTLARQVLGYALRRADRPPSTGHRGLFGRMGFEAVLVDLEERRERGVDLDALGDALPDELLHAVGFYGSAADAGPALSRLAAGLDEAVIRILTVRPGDTGAIARTLSTLAPVSRNSAGVEAGR